MSAPKWDMTNEDFRRLAARTIDTSWYYSWHWPERGWEKTALDQCGERIERTMRDLEQLEALKGLLHEKLAIDAFDDGCEEVLSWLDL